MRAEAARSLAACSTAWWTSCAGTSTVSLTLSSPTCSTVFGIGEPLNQTCTVRAVDVGSRHPQPQDAQAVRRAPVDESIVRELVELARHAPNHHLTQPWRFRLLGPATRALLEQRCGEKEAVKLRRAPTLVLATAVLTGDE